MRIAPRSWRGKWTVNFTLIISSHPENYRKNGVRRGTFLIAPGPFGLAGDTAGIIVPVICIQLISSIVLLYFFYS